LRRSTRLSSTSRARSRFSRWGSGCLVCGDRRAGQRPRFGRGHRRRADRGIGAFCGALVNVLIYPSLAAVATAHLSQVAAARFLVTAFNSGFGHAFLYAYFIGIFAAPVLLGFALWRSRSVPRWLAVLFVVGLELAQQVQSTGIVVVLAYTLLFAVAMILLAAGSGRQPPVRPHRRTAHRADTPLAAASPDPRLRRCKQARPADLRTANPRKVRSSALETRSNASKQGLRRSVMIATTAVTWYAGKRPNTEVPA
jgi:hypothetical protein